MLLTVLEAGLLMIKEPADAVPGQDTFHVPQLAGGFVLPSHKADVEMELPWASVIGELSLLAFTRETPLFKLQRRRECDGLYIN